VIFNVFLKTAFPSAQVIGGNGQLQMREGVVYVSLKNIPEFTKVRSSSHSLFLLLSHSFVSFRSSFSSQSFRSSLTPTLSSLLALLALLRTPANSSRLVPPQLACLLPCCRACSPASPRARCAATVPSEGTL
jgi:hypothetical protein